MTVLAWPKGNNNPYTSILYSALEKEGVRVLSHRKKRISFIFNKIDIFHFHWLNSFLNQKPFISAVSVLSFIIYIYILKIKKVKVIWTLHNTENLTHHRKNKNLEKLLSKYLFYSCDKFIYHSKYQFEKLKNCIKSRAIYIPHHNYLSILGPNEDTAKKDYFICFGSNQ